jgi:lambda repressor-like predicted transcriptional regulator
MARGRTLERTLERKRDIASMLIAGAMAGRRWVVGSSKFADNKKRTY